MLKQTKVLDFRELAHVLSGQSLITIYKSFIRLHLGYGDISHDQLNNESFCTLIKRTFQLKIYNELGNESLKFRRWFRRLYVHELLPTESHTYNTCKIENVETCYCRTDAFKYSFFPYVIVEWNKPDINL